MCCERSSHIQRGLFSEKSDKKFSVQPSRDMAGGEGLPQTSRLNSASPELSTLQALGTNSRDTGAKLFFVARTRHQISGPLSLEMYNLYMLYRLALK